MTSMEERVLYQATLLYRRQEKKTISVQHFQFNSCLNEEMKYQNYVQVQQENYELVSRGRYEWKLTKKDGVCFLSLSYAIVPQVAVCARVRIFQVTRLRIQGCMKSTLHSLKHLCLPTCLNYIWGKKCASDHSYTLRE